MIKSVAVVTGAADGIGWAIAQKFADEGFRVVVSDIDRRKAADRAGMLGEGHIAVAADVSSEDDVVALARRVARDCGQVDVLVNNAGIGDAHVPTLDQPMDHFDKVVAVHLRGTFLMCREIGRLMVARGQGAIVNISSIAGITGLPRRNAYGAAKAGIVSLTRSMACEWAPKGVRVNAVAPGYVGTNLVRALAAEGKVDIGRIERRIPMGHLAEPADIADAVHFLGSSAARYITGALLSVDGGWQAFGDAGHANDAEGGEDR